MATSDKLDIAAPDNPADITVTLQISGNRLVSVLNTLDAVMYETGRYRLVGNDVVSQHHSHLRALTEAIRDELSAQRMAASDLKAEPGPDNTTRMIREV